jgi:hypothetical protein
MVFLLLKAETNVEWINNIAEIPIIGDAFLFILMFVPAVLFSFLLHSIIPALNDDIGFTKAMFILLPGCNLILWLYKIRLYIFFIPSWILFGVIAVIKTILMLNGIDN